MGFIKKIIAITGTRADYGIYTSIFEKLDKEFDFSIIVTGMHLDKSRGYTIKEILKDGYKICGMVNITNKKNTHVTMAEAVGKAIIGITKILEKETPDILMVLGDRGEMLAGAISAVHLNIPIAHLHGGELSGSVDDNLRHSITKLSHIHFVSNEDSRKRVIQLGENPKYVINVGAPSLDTVINKKLLSEKETRKKFGIYDKKYLLLVFHPTTTDIESPKSQIKIILNSLSRFNVQTIAVKSNTDAGGDLINNELAKFENKTNLIKVFSNIPYIDYLSLLKYCTLLIGNSSSGIIEAPSFKIPVINIGNRQKGRVRAKNIYDVRYNENEIYNTVIKLINAPDIKKDLKNTINPYGNGKASSKITNYITKLENKVSLINKNFYNLIEH